MWLRLASEGEMSLPEDLQKVRKALNTKTSFLYKSSGVLVSDLDTKSMNMTTV